MSDWKRKQYRHSVKLAREGNAPKATERKATSGANGKTHRFDKVPAWTRRKDNRSFFARLKQAIREFLTRLGQAK